VMEYCQSDLKKLFKSPIHLEEDHIKIMTYQILCAMKYL
jgi:mitogen-activated protein kinase 1/3